MQSRRWFLGSVAAMALMAPRWSFAMQNIKCVVVDRKLRAEWTEGASVFLERTTGAIESVKTEAGLPPRYSDRLQGFIQTTRETGERIETPELRETFGRVARNLSENAERLKGARQAAGRLEALQNIRRILKKHIS
ncbi:MAG: hypothetical protein AAFV53_00460 [Myxococcota bacterium]